MVESEKWIDMGYVEEELDEIDSFVIHNKDFGYQYSSLRQMCDKYMLKNKHTGQLFESPQFMFMLIAMDTFRHSLSEIKDVYDALSQFKITLPTPELKALRTKSTDYASCCTVRIGDNIDSWNTGSSAIVNHTCSSAGVTKCSCSNP